ncbi:hypothetical protein D9M69_415760 [compost metagenome]
MNGLNGRVGQIDTALAIHHRPQTAREGIVFTDEAGDEGSGRFFVEFARRSHLLDDPIIEDCDTVRHGQCFGLVMGDVHHRDAQPLVQAFDLVLHLLAQILVERPQGLVHQHQLGLENQRASKGNSLLLPTGELTWCPIALVLHFHHRQRRIDPLFNFRLGYFSYGQWIGQVLRNGHVRKQRIVLKDHAYPTLVRCQLVDELAIEADFSLGRRFETGEHH